MKGLYLPILIGILAIFSPSHSFSQNPSASSAHPMDALNKAEYKQTVKILSEAGHVNDDSRFAIIHLKEMPKAEVLQWKTGDPIQRTASVVVKQGPKTFEGQVNLSEEKVDSWEEIKGVQPPFLYEEYEGMVEICAENEEWKASMEKRGYTSYDEIFASNLSAGYFGEDAEAEKRITKLTFFDVEGVEDHVYGRPIEGLTVVIDLNERKVLEVIDTGVIPINKDNHDYNESAARKGSDRPEMNPVTISAPNSNIKRNGSMIEWDLWKFHVRLDKRVGTILSLIKFHDESIIYQISANEMFVPYMDPDLGWYYRSYMDVGEYGLSNALSPLSLTIGKDCPEDAMLLNELVSDDRGDAFEADETIAIFERNTGRPLWRHFEVSNFSLQSRASVELVVRMIATVGNYDYLIDYIFTQNGEFKVEIGATGIDAVKGVRTQHMSDPTAAEDTKHGALIAPGLVGVYHDHYLSFRVDIDVAGQSNSFLQDHIIPQKYPKGSSPRISGWRVQPHIQETEGPVMQGKGHHHDAYWRVVHSTAKNKMGNARSYHLRPGHSHLSILEDKDYPQQRAAFSKHHLWVTPYHADELYPAGKYPNQNKGGDGIPRWVADKESVADKDIVLWYTIGFHHLTIAEDWPILPTMYHGFTLRPYHFFDRNPALDVKMKE
ncbi:MAG: tyramine oxidase [Bacteroidota bacterium]